MLKGALSVSWKNSSAQIWVQEVEVSADVWAQMGVKVWDEAGAVVTRAKQGFVVFFFFFFTTAGTIPEFEYIIFNSEI